MERIGLQSRVESDLNASQYYRLRQAYWDRAPDRMQKSKGWGKAYHRRLIEVYRNLIPPGQRVIEFGCGMGDLLAAVEPGLGVGVDFSARLITPARKRHPDLHFIQADVHKLCLNGPFDVILISDLLNDVWDVQKIFEEASRLSGPHTRVVINSYSRLWEIPLALAQRVGLAQPTLQGNWLTVEDITNLLKLADLEVIRRWHEVLFPLPVPLIASLANKFLVRLWPFHNLALSNFILARPVPQKKPQSPDPLVSVIVPARNEAGNIEEIFNRTPEMGRGTELVFVEGHSSDSTYESIQAAIKQFPERTAKLLAQSGEGKGDAVRMGFENASGDVLMILDADLTVPPEDLPRFYDALRSGKGEFINGVRLVYPMEAQAMRYLNFLGNKFFTLAFSWLLGQPIKDTLCGTKVLWKSDYEQISANRAYFGDFDPFGDFDLIFGAVRHNRKIIDMPIRYRERKYGTTNIQRWKHGWLLLKMVYFAAWRFKFK